MMSTATTQPSGSAVPPAARCSALVKHYGKVIAVDGLDLDVRQGECLGLLGPNGAGKTTTVEILEGLTPPTSGTVEVLGRGWGQGEDRWLRQRLGIQLQETQLPDKLTVEEVVSLFRSFYSGGRGTEDAIRTVELEEKRRSRIEKLSGGQKQRLSLACALVGDPQILFLDEPTTGLDPQARLKIWQVVEEFRGRGGTVVLTTHYMEEATRLCDRVAILDHGRIIALDTPNSLIASLGADQIIEFKTQSDIDPTPIAELPGVGHLVRRGEAYALSVSQPGESLPALLAALDEQGARLASLTTHDATLEDVFVHLTGRHLRDE